MEKYYSLTHMSDSAHCPFCNVYAHHTWYKSITAYEYEYGGYQFSSNDINVSECQHCNGKCIWLNGNLIYPSESGVPTPNEDLPDEIIEDYLEAASVLHLSPRSAAALLRLCVQKLCKHLGEKGENINTDIKELVKKGLPLGVQQAMDSIRVIGNNAVHPGEINTAEDKDTPLQLFSFINIIAEVMITQPKRIAELYITKLPEGAREAIEKRDQPKS